MRIDDRSGDALEERVVKALKAEALVRGELHRWLNARLVASLAMVILVAAAALAVLFERRAVAPGELYMLALYNGPAYRADPGDRARAAEYGRWARSHREGGAVVVSGQELGPAAATLGPASGHDPSLAGFFIVRAHSREAAVALTRTSPHLRYGGTIVVREIAG